MSIANEEAMGLLNVAKPRIEDFMVKSTGEEGR